MGRPGNGDGLGMGAGDGACDGVGVVRRGRFWREPGREKGSWWRARGGGWKGVERGNCGARVLPSFTPIERYQAKRGTRAARI